MYEDLLSAGSNSGHVNDDGSILKSFGLDVGRPALAEGNAANLETNEMYNQEKEL